MGTNRLNNTEIKTSFLRFLVSFAVLLCFSFLSLFCFFKSADLQRENIVTGVSKYKEVLNKHYLLKNKVDTVYYHMTLLSTGKVRSDVFLENYINQDIHQIRAIIGEDREGDFRYYSQFVTKLDSIVKLKNQIITISDQEQLALRDLSECMGRFKKVYTELTEDPVRKFNKK